MVVYEACPHCGEQPETHRVELWSYLRSFTVDDEGFIVDWQGVPAEGADDPSTGLYGPDGEVGVICGAGCGHTWPLAAPLSVSMVLKLGALVLPASMLTPIIAALEAGADESSAHGDMCRETLGRIEEMI